MFLKISKEKVTKARFSRRSAQNQVPKAQFPSNARFPSASKRKAIKARVPKGVLHAGFPQQVPKTHQLPTLSFRNMSKPTSFGPEFCQIRAPKLLPDSGPEAPAAFFLAFYLNFFLAFYLTVFLAVNLACTQVEVRQCPLRSEARG